MRVRAFARTISHFAAAAVLVGGGAWIGGTVAGQPARPVTVLAPTLPIVDQAMAMPGTACVAAEPGATSWDRCAWRRPGGEWLVGDYTTGRPVMSCVTDGGEPCPHRPANTAK